MQAIRPRLFHRSVVLPARAAAFPTWEAPPALRTPSLLSVKLQAHSVVTDARVGASGVPGSADPRSSSASSASPDVAPRHQRRPDVSDQAPLSSAKDINTGKLAGAIANRLRNAEVCEIDAVGPESQHSAIKAISMAQQWFEKDGEFPGTCFAVHPHSVDIPATGSLPPSKMCRMRLRPVRGRADGREQPDIWVGRDANPGLLAGNLKNMLARFPRVELTSMGAVATSRALKALIIANKYVRDSGQFREGQVVVATVRGEEVLVQQDTRQRVRWTCLLDPPNKAHGA